MIVGRFFGLFFVICSVLALARDFWVSYQRQTWLPIPLGELWYDISRTTLVAIQVGTQRYIGEKAWAIIDAMLSVWAFVAFLLIGIGLMIAFRRRTDIVE